MKKIIFVFIQILSAKMLFSQGCCSGGSASPIAGGTSQGVLNEKQFEVSLNHQFLSSNRFYAQDSDTIKLFNELSSNYLYLRTAYGLGKKFTLSLEAGYFLNKTQRALLDVDTIKTSGFSDVLIFPRYQIFYSCSETKKTEAVLGLACKIPIGSHNDSTVFYTDPMTNKKYYQTAPPTVQLTNGSNDFIFYGFWFRNYLKKNFRMFSNAIYVRKGWNSLGQKFGDYASLSLFFSTSVLKKRLGLTAQIKGEWIGMMKADRLVDMVAFYNIYTESTGSSKVFIAPQISYSYKNISFFVFSEIPIYQYLNGVQVGSQYQLTSGLSYKFEIKTKKEICN